ncbi:MAG: response regulator [Candidatus Margulisbacteria bacterium]|nr:response regulator [Candidatus Margulisiibacteriota bacterium]
MKIIYFLYKSAIWIISIPLGIIIGWIGVTVGIIEDTFISIKREIIETKKYPEYKKQQLLQEKISKTSSIKDPAERSATQARILQEGQKLPSLSSAIFVDILVNVVLFPAVLVLTIFKGPQSMAAHLINRFETSASGQFKNLPKAPRHSKKPLILVTEDDPDMRKNILYVVNKSGLFEPITAGDGLEAQEQMVRNRRFFGLARNRIQCIILDLKMPNMTGMEFLKRLRAQEYFITIMPVIVLTAYEDKEIWNELTDKRSGYVCQYLKKPLEPDKLIEQLQRIYNGEMQYMIDETAHAGNIRRTELGSEAVRL